MARSLLKAAVLCMFLAGVSAQVCEVPDPSAVGDGNCDPPPYNTHECLWDRGDCCEDKCVPPRRFLCGTMSPFNCQDPYGECSEFLDQGKLDILYHPVLDAEMSGFMDMNNLTMTVRVPTIYDPTKTTITFVGAGDDGSELDPSSIFYPDRWVIEPVTDPCWQYYTLHVPWSDFSASEGGLEQATTQNYVVNNGVLCIENREVIFARKDELLISEYRSVIDKIPFTILFPRFIDAEIITLDIHFVPMNVRAIILQHVLEVDPTGGIPGPNGFYTVHAVLHLKTLIERDWYFFSGAPAPPTIVVDDPNHFVQASILEDCDINDPEVCEQLWEIEIFSRSDECDIDGMYMLTLSIGCKPIVTCDQEMAPGDMFLVVDIILEGTEVCPAVEIMVDPPSANLRSFYEGCFGIDYETDTFAIGDRLCIIAETLSEQLAIIGTEVVQIIVEDVDSGLSSVLYDNGLEPIPEVDLEIFSAEEIALPNWAQFAFTVADVLLPNYDGWSQLDLFVRLEVMYSNLMLLEQEMFLGTLKRADLLQEESGNPNHADVEIVTGIAPCHNDYCNGQIGQPWRNDPNLSHWEILESGNLATSVGCCVKCYQTEGCTHWDYSASTDTCTLYNGDDEASNAEGGVTEGSASEESETTAGNEATDGPRPPPRVTRAPRSDRSLLQAPQMNSRGAVDRIACPDLRPPQTVFQDAVLPCPCVDGFIGIGPHISVDATNQGDCCRQCAEVNARPDATCVAWSFGLEENTNGRSGRSSKVAKCLLFSERIDKLANGDYCCSS